MADNQKGKQTMKNPGFKMDQETVMTKEASVRRAVRCPGRNDGTGFSLLVLVLALLGVIVAGRSQAPIISILVWPTQLVCSLFSSQPLQRKMGFRIFSGSALDS
jgi:hypothetical protein